MRRLFFLLLVVCVCVACGTAHGRYDGEDTDEGDDDDTGVGGDDDFTKIKDLTWTDTDGNTIDLYELAGNVVLLNVGAGWCVACKEETPSLQNDIWERFREEGFVLIQLIYQDPEGQPADQEYAQQWKDEFSLDYTVCPDPDNSLHEYFLEELLPFSMILDRDLNIRLSSHAYDVDAFTATIEELL